MLLKGKEIAARSGAGVTWSGISFEKWAFPRVAHAAIRSSDKWRVPSDEQSPSPLDWSPAIKIGGLSAAATEGWSSESESGISRVGTGGSGLGTGRGNR